MTSPKINDSQLELFAQDFFAALEPAAKPSPPPMRYQSVFRIPVPVLSALGPHQLPLSCKPPHT